MRRRVVVLNPSPELANLFAALLRHAGYHAVASSDASFVLGEVVRGAVDLVVTSFPESLPDGRTLVQRVRALPSGATTPFINLTANRDPAEHTEAASAGIAVTLTLPVEPARLLGAVERLIGPAAEGVPRPPVH